MNKANLRCFVSLWILMFHYSKETMAQAFTDQTTTAGITMTHDGDTALDLMSIGTGAAWIDFDNDGDQDLYVTMRYEANKLYENNNNGTFTEIIGALGAANAENDGSGVAVADFNNDGWPDFYLANGDEDRLFLNDNGTAFNDITNSAGFDMTDDSRGTSATWGDFDNNGYVDLYVAHHNQVSGAVNASSQDKLYYNNGDNTFTDVSHLLPSTDIIGMGFIGAWTDYDHDGYLDVFLVNDCLWPDYIPSKIFRNNGSAPSGDPKVDWGFTEVSVGQGVDDCRNGMGIAVGDYDRDSRMDVFYSNVGDAVLFNNGHTPEAFQDVSSTAGIDGQVWPLFSWGTFFFDYDLDGWQDLFLALGNHHNNSTDPLHPNMLFHNDGDGTFTDQSIAMGMADNNRGRTCIYGDYDNDGDPDVFLANFGEAAQLKRNENANGHHYLWINLEGVSSNRDGIGAKLKLTAADNSIQYFEMRSGSSLGGGDQLDAHFGLGTNESALELEITWPSGIVQVIPNPPIDRMLEITENVPLDVELSEFTAKLDENEKVILNWTTLSEENNKFFSIQRSVDAKTFLEIGTVEGKGTITEVNHYRFIDNNPSANKNYYRLKQTDFDKSKTYSEIREVTYKPQRFNLQVYPNPLKTDLLHITCFSETKKTMVKVLDGMGVVLIQQEIRNQGLEFIEFDLDLAKLSAGVYILMVENEAAKTYEKIIRY